MRLRVLFVLLAAVLGIVSCRQEDIRTKTIRVPQMKNAKCSQIVTAVLGKTEGVRPATIKAGEGTVTVTYDSMKLGLKNLEAIIAQTGFDANDTPADPKAQAALPADCR